MNTHYESILESASEWLATVDENVFLQEFLVLQENATGPTVDEFLLTFTISTNSLFGLVDNCDENSVFNKFPLSNSTDLKVSKANRKEAIASFTKAKHHLVGMTSITEPFNLEGKIINSQSYGFHVENIDNSFCKVA